MLGLAIIGALAFFLLRRRQGNTLYDQPSPTDRAGAAKQSELDAEKPLAAPAYASETDVKPYMQPFELLAVSTPQELSVSEQERQLGMRVHIEAIECGGY